MHHPLALRATDDPLILDLGFSTAILTFIGAAVVNVCTADSLAQQRVQPLQMPKTRIARLPNLLNTTVQKKEPTHDEQYATFAAKGMSGCALGLLCVWLNVR